MTTLGIMKARIASEVRRSNISSQIASAISDAIAAYQGEPFAFNETRAFTISLVAGQEFYTSSDDADVGNITSIDYVKIYLDNDPYELTVETPRYMEALSQNGTQTGQPHSYCYYGEALRFYPAPDHVYTCRIGCTKKVAAPASDEEASNPWMIAGERLIRCRAKYELAAHVLNNVSLMQMFDPERPGSPTDEAYRQLKRISNRVRRPGQWVMTPTEF